MLIRCQKGAGTKMHKCNRKHIIFSEEEQMIVNLTLRPIEQLKNITIIGTMNNFITDLILRYNIN